MMTLKVKDKEYKIKFGYNSFCDTDLMDRTETLLRLFQSTEAENDKDVSALGKVKDLFLCVRDLLFVGFQKYNPVSDVREVGDIIDDYHDEAKEGEKRGVMDIFTQLSEELMNEGFLGEILNGKPEQNQEQEQPENPKVVEMKK